MSTSAWDEVQAAIAAAPYPVEVLPTDPEQARRCTAALGITTKSWLGAVTTYTGGLLIDHGWLRVLGGGSPNLGDVVTETEAAGGLLVVGHDILGGQYVWMAAGPDARPTIHYFGSDELVWKDLGQGYSDWLYAMLTGAVTAFYAPLRWPGWEREVRALKPNEGIHAFPPPWTVEGKNLATVSRSVVPVAQLIAFHQDTAQQLG